MTFPRIVTWAIDAASGEVLSISPSYEAVFGHSAEELRAQPDSWQEAVHEGDRQVLKELPERLEMLGFVRLSYLLHAGDGRERRVEHELRILRDSAEKPVRIEHLVNELAPGKATDRPYLGVDARRQALARLRDAAESQTERAQRFENVLREFRLALDADRAWILDPFESEGRSWRIVHESVAASFGGARRDYRRFEVGAGRAALLRKIMSSEGPVQYEGSEQPVDVREVLEHYSVRHSLVLAMRTSTEEPWLLGLHRCVNEEPWTEQEQNLFAEMAELLHSLFQGESVRRTLPGHEELMRQLADDLPAVIFSYVIDEREQRRLLYASPGLGRLMGERSADALGRDLEALWDRIHPEDLRTRAVPDFPLGEDGSIIQGDFRLRTDEGAYRWIRYRARLRLMEDGQGLWKGILTDIEQHKRAETLLAERESLGRSLLRLSRAMERAADVDQVLAQTYQEVQVRLGLSTAALYASLHESPDYVGLVASCGTFEEQLIGALPSLSTEDDPLFTEILAGEEEFVIDDLRGQAQLAGHPLCRIDCRTAVAVPIHLSDGGRGCLLLASFGEEGAAPLSAPQQEYLQSLAGLVGVGLDRARLRERRERISTELQRSQGMLELILDSIPLRVFWKDRHGTYLGCNRVCARDAGLRGPEEIVGKNDYDLAWNDLADAFREQDARVLRTGRPVIAEENVRVDADGRPRWFCASKVPLRGKDGEIIGLLGYAEEVSERRWAEEECRRLESAALATRHLETLGLMAGGLAHDFNNLLLCVLGNVELARQRLLEDEATQENLQEIEAAALRAKALSRQLFVYSGRGGSQKSSVRLSEIVREMAAVLEETLPLAQPIQLRLDEDLPILSADPAQLRLACASLVQALRHGRPDDEPCIRLSTVLARCPADLRREGALDSIVLAASVHDPKLPSSVPRPWLDPELLVEYHGSQPQLAVVEGVAQAHGGRLYHRKGLGATACILLYLPSTESAPAGEESPRPPAQAAAGGHTILVVDDEERVLHLATRILESAGYRTVTARDGLEAVELHRERAREISLVLLDAAMPRLDGPSALARIRRVDPDVPVILSSGYHDSGERIGGLPYDRSQCSLLPKPYSSAELLESVGASLAAAVGRD